MPLVFPQRFQLRVSDLCHCVCSSSLSQLLCLLDFSRFIWCHVDHQLALEAGFAQRVRVSSCCDLTSLLRTQRNAHRAAQVQETTPYSDSCVILSDPSSSISKHIVKHALLHCRKTLWRPTSVWVTMVVEEEDVAEVVVDPEVAASKVKTSLLLRSTRFTISKARS